MVCEKVAQIRHDNLANALRLVVSTCSCQSAAEPRYQALAGKGMAEYQRSGDIAAVLSWLELAAVDVVVPHASAQSYAAKTAGWTAARAEQTNRHGSGRIMLNSCFCAGSCRIPVFAVCGGDVRVRRQGGGEGREPPWGHRPHSQGCICVLDTAAAFGDGTAGGMLRCSAGVG